MLDIETLGLKPGCVIMTIGCMLLKRDPIPDETFYIRVSIESSEKHGLKVEPQTLEWWNSRSKEARDELFSKELERVDLPEALDHLTEWFKKHNVKYVWAKDPDFDCSLLKAAYEACGKKIPWEYYSTRSVRTILDIADRFMNYMPVSRTVAHHALEDCKTQTYQVLGIMEKLSVYNFEGEFN
jgi:hypothetical protein